MGRFNESTGNTSLRYIMETGITATQIVNEMNRIAHGKYEEYVPVIKQACAEKPELVAHAIGYNTLKGQVRDSQIALPVITLTVPSFPEELLENSLAHLARMSPFMLLKACKFAKSMRPPVQWVYRVGDVAGQVYEGTVKDAKKQWGAQWQKTIQDIPLGRANVNRLESLIHRYLKTLETNWKKWERTAVQHRAALKNLYSIYRVKPSDTARQILFEGAAPRGTIFEKIRNLSTMSPDEAAGVIKRYKLPAVVIAGAAGKKLQETSVAMAMIDRATPNEVVNMTRLFKKLGSKNDPVVRAAYEQALKRVAESKTNTFKTTVAAEAMEEEGDDVLATKLRAAQEKQINQLGGIDGNWLILGDKSPSMEDALEGAKVIAGALARAVRGKVMLVFFATDPEAFDVTGKTYEQIKEMTKYVRVGSGTSIGVGLKYAMEKKFEIDGVAIASDAKENTAPFFAQTLTAYKEQFKRDPSVYLYRFAPKMTGYGDTDLKNSMHSLGLDMNEFDLTRQSTVDYFSLPNHVQTMKVGRYTLLDEIMAVPLLTVDEVLAPLPAMVTR